MELTSKKTQTERSLGGWKTFIYKFLPKKGDLTSFLNTFNLSLYGKCHYKENVI